MISEGGRDVAGGGGRGQPGCVALAAHTERKGQVRTNDES